MFFQHKANPNLKTKNPEEPRQGKNALAYFYEITSDGWAGSFDGSKHDEIVMLQLLLAGGVAVMEPGRGKRPGWNFKEFIESDVTDHPRQALWLSVLNDFIAGNPAS